MYRDRREDWDGSGTLCECMTTDREVKLYTVCSSSSSFLACNSRLRSAIHRHHPPQRAVLSQICCFGEHKMVLFQILLDSAAPCDAGTTRLSSPVCRRGANRILLASALSSMRIICPNKVSRRDWIIAVSLGCFHYWTPKMQDGGDPPSWKLSWRHFFLLRVVRFG